MNLKKILSFALTGVFIASSFHGVFADYGNYNDNGDYIPPVKIQKLIKLENKLTPYIEAQVNKRIQTIQDKKLKLFYLVEINLQKEKIKRFFENLQYTYSDDKYNEKLAELRADVVAIRDLIVEAEKSQSLSVNPYEISDSEREKVEANLLGGQKDIVSYLRDMLQMYEGKDMKQSQPSVFHFEGEIGTIDVNFEKYSSIFSWATGNQQLDMSLKANVDLKIPGGYELDKNGAYKAGKSKSVKGTAKLDGEVKTIDSDMYFTLNDYSIDLSSDDKPMTTELKEVKTTLDAFKGKTIHIKLGDAYGQPTGNKVLRSFTAILDTLEKESLLTPYKKVDGNFSLEPKRSTLDDITKAMGVETLDDTDYLSIRKEFHMTPLWYADIDNGFAVWSHITENGMSGDVKLKSIYKEYTFTTDLSSASGDKVTTEIRKGYIKSDILSDDTSVNILWENNLLNVVASGKNQKLVIAGPFSSTTADLKITFNDKQIGSIKVDGTKTHSEYNIQFGMDIPNIWKFNWKGTVDIEHGNYPIDTPTNAVELNKVLPSGSSSGFESGAINPLDF